MTPKRKSRPLNGSPLERPRPKKTKLLDEPKNQVRHSLLRNYYENVQTLREYLLSSLPASSRLRRKKIASLRSCEATSLDKDTREIDTALVTLLDTALVCTLHHPPKAKSASRWEQWRSFSQKGDESVVTLSGELADASYSQSEIVDFAIWQLFSRLQSLGSWPKHILCDGFRRQAQNVGGKRRPHGDTSLPGLTSVHPNHFVQALKDAPWPQVLMLLGKSGEQIMIDLLIDTAIFLPVQAGTGNMYQISGTPILEPDPFVAPNTKRQLQESKGQDFTFERLPSEVTFMRNRILYARAALTGRGTVQYGLRHIHVLNRCPRKEQNSIEENLELDQANERNTTKVMMYIFPRQFSLHNVFTSQVDFSKTSQKFADYTLREEEIASAFKERHARIPKRLRGDAKRLVERLQLLHGRCAYAEMLRHYCPSAMDNVARKPQQRKGLRQSQRPDRPQVPMSDTRPISSAGRPRSVAKNRHKSRPPASSAPMVEFDNVTDLATPLAQVSAFCRAVLSRLVPNEFWGNGDSQAHNKDVFFKKVDHFIKLRRFESMSVLEVADGMKVAGMDWLAPPALKGQKTSQSDMKKRLEILNEFLYYVFDSILIPLLRSNFYVTESSSHRYRLFFFRHDVWRHVAEPAMATLRTNMLEEVKLNQANRILESRRLGFSRIRLLPKGKSMRPITNLRRRAAVRGRSNYLGPSINSVLGPVHSMLKLETERNPSKLGSSMFSVGDIYPRLNAFSARFGDQPPLFYFAKVDVQAAFDTIPQEAVVRLMEDVPSEEQYVIRKHLEVRAGLLDYQHQKRAASKLTRRWHSVAATRDDPASFVKLIEDRLGSKRKNAVFVGNMSRKEHETHQLMALMSSHVRQNLVKVGKKFYRQKKGIPQGSVLSSALCNYFYADLEAHRLSFLTGDGCLLLRLIDDFLLITTSRQKAHKFVEIMHDGLPEYGVTVSPKKTLVNFDMELGDVVIPRVPDESQFPYCGLGIDCRSLNIVKTGGTAKSTAISNALTVDFGHKPGQNFQRRILNAFKIQSHLMFYDTTHNSLETVMSNLHKAFSETAEKMTAYWRCLPPGKRPDSRLVAQTITKMIDVALVLLTSKARKSKYPGYDCSLEKTHVAWLAFDAVRRILLRRQANFAPVLSWIGREMGTLDSAKTTQARKCIQ